MNAVENRRRLVEAHSGPSKGSGAQDAGRVLHNSDEIRFVRAMGKFSRIPSNVEHKGGWKSQNFVIGKEKVSSAKPK
jgi:hypothetical protein